MVGININIFDIPHHIKAFLVFKELKFDFNHVPGSSVTSKDLTIVCSRRNKVHNISLECEYEMIFGS